MSGPGPQRGDWMNRDWRAWAPDLVAAGVVFVLGLVETVNTDIYTVIYSGSSRWELAVVALGVAAAVGLARRMPAAALGLVWVGCTLQVVLGIPVMTVQLAVAYVAFGTARWGSPATVVAGFLSIPAAALIALVLVASDLFFPSVPLGEFSTLVDVVAGFGDVWQVGATVLGTVILVVPWLAGLTLRFLDRAHSSRASQVAAEGTAAQALRETEQAREIARLRDDQVRLARDVHDVVGHSLAVILAQAESAQYLDDVDADKLKQTMENIATSARTSLQDVRQVLTPTPATVGAQGSLDTLIAGVRGSGHELVTTEVGAPRPLPPELDVIAFRVLQEMLTNAIKHGRRDESVFVERHWPDGGWEGELRIEVRNALADAAAPGQGHGQGLSGMRSRLEAVGGRLDVRRRADPPSFTVTAWVPVRR
ncbi:MAG: histidine kinase [Nocardioides sp.]